MPLFYGILLYLYTFCSFSEIDENEESKTADDEDNVAKKGMPSSERKKSKRSASDVKKWLMRKPSLNRKKKNKESKETEKGKLYLS